MPKLWSETIETHRHEVREAIMETTWRLAVEDGPMSVTMSQIAQEAGIGRATLYKYFPDVETVLHAKHEQLVHAHMAQLRELRAKTDDPIDRLAVIAHAYARICHHRAKHGTVALSALTHQEDRVRGAEKKLLDLFEDVISEVIDTGTIQEESAGELALYFVHALGAASSLPSQAAAHRLTELVLGALHPAGVPTKVT